MEQSWSRKVKRTIHRIIIVRTSNVKQIPFVALEERTARLTILIDPRKKAVFERLCA